MIRFSKMADYGVLLLGHLARTSDELVSAASLAESYRMSRPVVANLLKEFCKAGLLESRRGLHGGYRLARDPDGITLLEILGVIDGPVQLTDCAAEELVDTCDFAEVCPSRSPMRAVNQRIVDFLEGLSLSELMADVAPDTIAEPISAPTTEPIAAASAETPPDAAAH